MYDDYIHVTSASATVSDVIKWKIWKNLQLKKLLTSQMQSVSVQSRVSSFLRLLSGCCLIPTTQYNILKFIQKDFIQMFKRFISLIVNS